MRTPRAIKGNDKVSILKLLSNPWTRVHFFMMVTYAVVSLLERFLCEYYSFPESQFQSDVLQRPNYMLVYFNENTRRHYFALQRMHMHTFGIGKGPAPETECHQVIPFLDFIIEKYDKFLPENLIFNFANTSAWVDLLKIDRDIREHVFNSKNLCIQKKAQPDEGDKIFLEKILETPVDTVLTPMCTSIAITVDRIRQKSRSDLIHLRDRIQEWGKQHTQHDEQIFCSRLLHTNWASLF